MLHAHSEIELWSFRLVQFTSLVEEGPGQTHMAPYPSAQKQENPVHSINTGNTEHMSKHGG